MWFDDGVRLTMRHGVMLGQMQTMIPSDRAASARTSGARGTSPPIHWNGRRMDSAAWC